MVEGTRADTIVAGLEGMKLRTDRTAVLGTLIVPMVAIVGAEDPSAPVTGAEDMVAATPRGELIVVAGVGHMAPIEDPVAVAAALAALWARAEPGGE
jgi:pimeloyl-ACP methyl ester carboxylesterase